MRRTIGIGRPVYDDTGPPKCTLNVAIWYSFVPEVYRDLLTEIAIRQALNPLMGAKITHASVDHAVGLLLSWIHANVEPR
jgi:hypothetical protein